MTNNPNDINDPIKSAFDNGELLVYATEAVMGIGCDPDNESAVLNLLKTKQRSIDKGLILVAADYSQLMPYVNDKAIPEQRRPEIFSSWPGPITWLLPKSASAPFWITGIHNSIATRVTAYQPLIELCQRLGKPIVSTSANLSGQESARNIADAKRQLGEGIVYVDSVVQGRTEPSMIKDALTGNIVRGQ